MRNAVLIGVLALMLVAIGAGWWYWQRTETPPVAPERVEAPKPPPTEEAEPAIRHPIEQARPQPEPAEKPLPPLAESDPAMRDAAGDLIGKEELKQYFHTNELARRFVVSVDSLPRKQMPQRYHVAKPAPGDFKVTQRGEAFTLDPENYRRYTPYIRIMESIDTGKLVSVYVYFYPLLQQEYENLGYPNRYFNDRVVAAIDDLLNAPEVSGPIELVRPKVYYRYADPTLEGLSSGQKLMIRIGPQNAARVKAKLRDIRKALTGADLKPASPAKDNRKP